MGSARRALPELVDRTRFSGERFRLQRYTKSVAAIVGIDDLELLESIDEALDREAVRNALEANEQVYDFDELRRELQGGPKARLRPPRGR